MAMLIEFDIPPQKLAQMDFELLQATFKPRKTRYRLIYAAVLLLYIGLVAYWKYIGAGGNPVVSMCIVAAGGIFISSIIGINLGRRLAVRKMATSLYHGQKESIRILPVRMDYLSDNLCMSSAWKHIDSVLRTNNYLFVMLNGTSIPIPLSAFGGLDHAIEFKSLAESYIAGKSNSSQTVPTDSTSLGPTQWPPAPKQPAMLNSDGDVYGVPSIVGAPVDQSKAVKFRCAYDEHDLLYFQYRFYTGNTLRSILLSMMQPLALCTLLVPLFASSTVKAALLAIAALAIVLTAYFVWRINVQVLKSLDKRSKEDAEIEIETDFVQFVTRRTESSCSNYRCSAFESVEFGAAGVCIKIGLGRFLPIPIRYFPDKQSAKEFYERLKVVVQ
jgi:hypothetical protein